MEQDDAKSYRSFPTTAWTTIFRAANSSEESRRAALERLLHQYIPALRAHLVFEKRLPRERADDILQGFITDKILEKDLIKRVDRKKGKFRTFLLRALDNYLISVLRRENADKRAPERARSLPAHIEQSCTQGSAPSDTFDLAWARRVLALTLQRMESHCEATHRQDIWGVFESRVLRPVLEQHAPLSYEEIIKQFEFDSPRQASNALVTAKRMFRRYLQEIVGEYTEHDWEIEEEINELKEILHRSKAGSAADLRR
jgi:RNA polymerase sigma-70 factor (ECF subfamily)